MPLNAKKCTVLRIGKENMDIDSNYLIKVRGISSIMAHNTSIKDLGVIIDDKLNFREHINSKVNKAYSTLGIIKRNFRQMDRITFIKLYKSIILPGILPGAATPENVNSDEACKLVGHYLSV